MKPTLKLTLQPILTHLKLLSLLLALSVALAEEGSVISFEHVARFSTAQIDQVIGGFFPQGRGLAAQDEVDLYRVRYLSSDLSGEPIEIIAQLFLPIRGEGALPIYVMGVGTTGLDETCAPSNEQPAVSNWGDYRAHMLSYATQGFISIMPDPAGFHDPELVPRYFMLEPAGQVLLDAARAAYTFLEDADYAISAAEAVFMGGYSAGGHAVFAASDLHASYAPELPLLGVIGYGPTTDIPAMMLASPYFSPYLIYAYSQTYPEVDPAALLQERWTETLASAVFEHCVDTLPNYYSNDPGALFTPDFFEALNERSFGGELAGFGELIETNSSGLRGGTVPALILQGTDDIVVYPQEQRRFAAQYCAGGGAVTYVTYANIRHFETRQFGYRDALAWMRSVADGEEVRDDCDAL